MDVTNRLRDDIVKGIFPPGTELQQTHLAGAYGVSRIPIRDALQALKAERLVSIEPGKGARVIELKRDELMEIFDLRVLLECDVLAKAIHSATHRDDDNLAYALRRSELEAGRPGWVESDLQFHATLYASANAPRQTSIIHELRMTCVVHSPQFETLSDLAGGWIADHTLLFDAYTARDTKQAVKVLERHIKDVRGRLLEKLPDDEVADETGK